VLAQDASEGRRYPRDLWQANRSERDPRGEAQDGFLSGGRIPTVLKSAE